QSLTRQRSERFLIDTASTQHPEGASVSGNPNAAPSRWRYVEQLNKRQTMSSQDKIQRSILPILDAQHVGLTTYDAKDPDTRFPPIESLRPPKGAPIVLVSLIDDCVLGAASAFGGPIATPNAERLAKNGLKFNRF